MSYCIGWPREQDPELHNHYAKKLLEPGWGGDIEDRELSYIKNALVGDRRFAMRWGFRPGQKTRSDEAIRRVAMEGDPEDVAQNRRLARPRKAHQTKSLPATQAKVREETPRSKNTTAGTVPAKRRLLHGSPESQGQPECMLFS